MSLLLFVSVDAKAETMDVKCSRASRAPPHNASAINTISVDTTAENRVETQHAIHAGVSFLRYAGTKHMQQPWQFSVLPSEKIGR